MESPFAPSLRVSLHWRQHHDDKSVQTIYERFGMNNRASL